MNALLNTVHSANTTRTLLVNVCTEVYKNILYWTTETAVWVRGEHRTGAHIRKTNQLRDMAKYEQKQNAGQKMELQDAICLI